MIAKNSSKQAINAVLLHLFRREEYCKNLQGNMFYNMEIIRTGYGSKAEQLKTQFEKVLWIKNRIEALNHLLYGKIWDLYYDFFAAVNRYNNDKAYLDQLKAQRETIDNDIDTARRNKETAYSNYEAAEAEYTRIQNDYDQRIANAILEKGRKESELSDARAHLAEKQTELANLQQLKDDFLTVSMELLGDRLKFSQSKVYPKTGSSYPDEGNTWAVANCNNPYVEITKQSVINYILDAQGETDHFTLGGYTFSNIANRYYLGVEYYNMFRVIVSTYDGGARFEGRGGTKQAILSSTGNKSSSSDVQSALASAVADAIAAIRSAVASYANGIDTSAIEADIAATEAQITQLENEIDYLENTTIPNLRSEKAAALEAQQAVIDSYWSSYTYWRDEQARLEKLKDDIKNLITVYEGVVDEDLTKVQDAADAYNSQLNAMDDKKVIEEGYPELPEPYNRGDHEPGPDVPVPDPRPPEEEEDPQDGEGGGSQSD